MKAFEQLSRVFAVAGILLAVYAAVGRFIHKATVFGDMYPPGLKASSVLIAANTLLLLAILSYLYKKQ